MSTRIGGAHNRGCRCRPVIVHGIAVDCTTVASIFAHVHESLGDKKKEESQSPSRRLCPVQGWAKEWSLGCVNPAS